MPAFLSWMLVASALGFAKVMILARILPPEAFGNYGSVAGIALLSSTLLSLGRVEGTIKLYPRVWIEGSPGVARAHARSVAITLAFRFAIAASGLLVLSLLVDLPYRPAVFMIGALLGFGNALLVLCASLIRATGSARLLQHFSVTRAVAALVLACGLGLTFSWQGAFAGDAIATLVTLLICMTAITSHFPRSEDVAPKAASGGGKLYLATLFSSSTGLADRAIVNLSLGPGDAGAYGVVALMVQVGQLTANIVAQRLGPAAIKAIHDGSEKGSGLRRLALPGVALLVLAIGLAMAMLLLWKFDLPHGMISRYRIGPTAIVLGGALAALQMFVLVEFLLIARDCESAVLLAGGIAAAVFFGLFGIAGLMRLPLEYFLAAAVAARTLHLTLLVSLTRRAARRMAAS